MLPPLASASARISFSAGEMKGGDEHAAVRGGVKPQFAVALPSFRGVCAMDYNLLSERVVEELEVTVGLVGAVADFQCIDTTEVFGIGFSHGQSARVFPEVVVEGVERAGVLEYLVVESFDENRGNAGLFVYLYLESDDNLPEGRLGGRFYEKKNV